MNTLTINSKAALTLARASEKARNEKPLVKKTSEYGVYEVQSSDKSRWYTVKCNSATKEITCNCKAMKPCYHIAAVAPLHSYIARQKQEAEKAAALAAQAEKQAQFEKDYADILEPIYRADAEYKANRVQGVVTTSMQELNNLIEQAIEECDAQEYTEADRAFDTACLFG